MKIFYDTEENLVFECNSSIFRLQNITLEMREISRRIFQLQKYLRNFIKLFSPWKSFKKSSFLIQVVNFVQDVHSSPLSFTIHLSHIVCNCSVVTGKSRLSRASSFTGSMDSLITSQETQTYSSLNFSPVFLFISCFFSQGECTACRTFFCYS